MTQARHNDGIVSAYERTPLRRITRDCLRPGGLELTRSGLEMCAFPPGGRILDLGCGAGASLGLLRDSGYLAAGIDLSPVLLREALGRAPVMRADIVTLPVRDSCLDGLLCECVLSLAPDKNRVLSECARVLKPGARLLLTDVALKESPPDAGSSPFPCIRGAETAQSYVTLLRDNGFSPVYVQDRSGLLRELAAQIIWEFGSWEEFFRLWPMHGGGETPCPPGTACGSERNLGYTLIVAERVPRPGSPNASPQAGNKEEMVTDHGRYANDAF